MKERAQIKIADLDVTNPRPRRNDTVTIAFSVAFEYENPELAMRVANDFVTSILNEDAQDRTNRAVETTKFLAKETGRLEAELAATEAQLVDLKRRPRDPSSLLSDTPSTPDPTLMQLGALKADLIQKSIHLFEEPS